MSKRLRILLVEDDASDADLIAAALKSAGLVFAIRRVQVEEDFFKALTEESPDVILADYTLPNFGGDQALLIARKHSKEIPFIIVSGTVGEEAIVELMREGVTDFVSKRNLEKLYGAVQRAMREVERQHQKLLSEASLRDSESRFRAIFESAGAGIAVEDLDGRIIETNRALQQMLGYSADELQEITRAEFTHSRDHEEDRRQFQRLLSGDSEFYQVEKRFVRRDGRIIWGRLTVSIVRDGTAKPQFSLAMIEDITERQRAEEAYMQYASLVEHSHDAIISTTLDGIVFGWNPAAERVYGHTSNEVNGRSLSMIMPSDKEEEELIHIFENVKNGDHVDNFETTRRRKDGQIIFVSITASPIKDASGKIIGASAISRDITERKQAEQALRESEENYRKLVELSPDGILILSEGKYVYLNSAALEIFGARTTGQILGKATLDVIHPDYHEQVNDNLKSLDAGRDLPLHELKVLRVDGLVVDVEISSIPFAYRGKPAYQIIVRNITERKRAEEALRRSEAGLARAQQIARLGSWEWDRRSEVLTWSDETYRIFGFAPDGCKCSNEFFFGCVHPEDRELVRLAIDETLKHGKPYSVDHRIVLPNGETKTVNEQAEVVLDDKGDAIRLLGTVHDITERKRAENLSAAFAKLGERLSSATSAAGAARIIAEEADKLFGWDAANLILYSDNSQTFESVFNMDLVDGKRQSLEPANRFLEPDAEIHQAIEQGAQLIVREPANEGVQSSGNTNSPRLAISNMYVPVRNGPEVVGVFLIRSYSAGAYTQNDLSALQALGDHCGGALERIRAETEKQKLAAFPEFNPNPVLELAANGSINYFNAATHEMAESLSRKHPSEFMPPETAAIVKECLATNEAKLRIITIIENRSISWSFFPVQTIGVVHCYAADITERQILESQLRQSQKMESIGQLAGGVAHDFNNILTVIQGHISLLSMTGNLNNQARDSAQQIGLAAERAANLTRQLLTFSRRQIMQPKNLDINEVVNNMTKMLRRLLGEDVALRVSYTPALPAIHADPGMIEQILLNLSVNSRDAMPRGGSLFIDTSLATIGDDSAKVAPDAAPGQYVCIAVRDTGSGIPPDVLPHIFEPFFTTKDVGKGTGLGLATVYGIVKQHHGWIKAESTVGKETVFKVFLPPIKAPASSNGGSGDSTTFEQRVRGGKENILLVEDELPLRVLVRSILERYGYRVLEASSGLAALGVWEKHKDEIQMLLTDMVMPFGVSGRELAAKLLAEKPELKVIYSSGYNLAVVGADMVLKEGLNFLQKPYHPRKLAQAVRDCLDM